MTAKGKSIHVLVYESLFLDWGFIRFAFVAWLMVCLCKARSGRWSKRCEWRGTTEACVLAKLVHEFGSRAFVGECQQSFSRIDDCTFKSGSKVFLNPEQVNCILPKLYLALGESTCQLNKLDYLCTLVVRWKKLYTDTGAHVFQIYYKLVC